MPTSKSNDPNQEKKPSASRTGASGQAQRRQTAARRRELERRRRERARRKRNRMIFRIVSIAALVVLVLLVAAGISRLAGKGNKKDSASVQEQNVAKAETEMDNSQTVDEASDQTDTGSEEAAAEPTPVPETKRITVSVDVTIGNFEGTLTESENRRQDRQFCFKAPAEYTNILKDGYIEAVTTANNHSHDYGEDGYTDTVANLDAAGITNVGYEKYAVYETNGKKIGIVGTYVLIEFLDCAPQMIENIKACKAEGADIVVVIFHWGDELATTPDYYQTTLGRMAIDEGADLVCGHHSHIIQGIEKYKGRYICYSLANFCFGGNSHPTDPDTFIFQQTFTVTGDEVAYDDSINIIPCLVSSSTAINNFQPTPLTGADADRVRQKIVDRTALVTDMPDSQEDSYVTTHLMNHDTI